MASSTLHLVVDKGPKQGETLDREPGTLIRIGRVVRGNTFAIKDPAISQKHLVIQFTADISQWTVTDLDTSNGTIVNDAKISPSAPFPLSDGDVIKIGETTSISVSIDGEGEVDGGAKRRRRKGANAKTETVESVAEEVKESSELAAEEPRGRGRGKRANSSRVSKKDAVLEEPVEERVEARPTRANTRRAVKKGEILDAVVEERIELRPRRAGARTRAASARVLTNEETTESNAEASPVRVSEKAEERIESNVEAAPVRVAEKAEEHTESNAEADPVTVSEKAEEHIESNPEADPVTLLENSEVLDLVAEEDNEVPKHVRGRGRGRARGRRAPAQTQASIARVSSVNEVVENENSNVESKANEEGKEAGSRQEEGERMEEEIGGDIDVEKMTLGEWFDSMEKYLPKAINEVAELMIASLREKARRFDEYVANAT